MLRRHFVHTAALGGLAATLAGCGFTLRQAPTFDFASLYAGFAPGSALGAQFRRSMAGNSQVRLLPQAQAMDADVRLEVLSDLRQKVVVGIGPTGQVREFDLRTLFRFRLVSREGIELIPTVDMNQNRSLSFNESVALAKETEEALLYRDMEKEVVNQLLRRLSTIRLA